MIAMANTDHRIDSLRVRFYFVVSVKRELEEEDHEVLQSSDVAAVDKFLKVMSGRSPTTAANSSLLS